MGRRSTSAITTAAVGLALLVPAVAVGRHVRGQQAGRPCSGRVHRWRLHAARGGDRGERRCPGTTASMLPSRKPYNLTREFGVGTERGRGRRPRHRLRAGQPDHGRPSRARRGHDRRHGGRGPGDRAGRGRDAEADPAPGRRGELDGPGRGRTLRGRQRHARALAHQGQPRGRRGRRDLHHRRPAADAPLEGQRERYRAGRAAGSSSTRMRAFEITEEHALGQRGGRGWRAVPANRSEVGSSLVDVDVSGNKVSEEGGGLWNGAPALFVRNSTVADNTADGSGGGHLRRARLGGGARVRDDRAQPRRRRRHRPARRRRGLRRRRRRRRRRRGQPARAQPDHGWDFEDCDAPAPVGIASFGDNLVSTEQDCPFFDDVEDIVDDEPRDRGARRQRRPDEDGQARRRAARRSTRPPAAPTAISAGSSATPARHRGLRAPVAPGSGADVAWRTRRTSRAPRGSRASRGSPPSPRGCR